MCVVTTELSYGTLIRCFDLAIAAHSHKELVGPVLAVRMIAQRQREGTLATKDGGGRTEKVPPEVWDMVRKVLVMGALVRGKSVELERWRCHDAGECRCQSCSAEHLPSWGLPNCDQCTEHLIEHNGRWASPIFDFNTGPSGPITLLLEEYGLESKQVVNKAAVDDRCLFDFDAAYLVGRPTEGHVVIETIIHHDEPYRMLSQSQVPTLVRDVATDDRLRALISDYRLPASIATIPTYPGYASTADKRRGGTWTMWTTCESCM